MSRYALTDTVAGILEQPVKERNQNAMVRCPFHDDRLASLSINLDNGLWICFGCGERGGLHSLATRLGKVVDDVEVTLRTYEAAAGNPYYEERKDFSELAKALRTNLLAEKPDILFEFIVNRGLSPKVVRHFGLGYNLDGRLAFPYYDDEEVFAIKYRDRSGNKSSEQGSKRGVYNINEVRFRPTVILCEGESDTLAVWTYLTEREAVDSIGVGGIPGAAVSAERWEAWATELLWAKRVLIGFDNDDAGEKGAQIAMSVIGERASRLTPDKGKDWTEHLLNGGTIEY